MSSYKIWLYAALLFLLQLCTVSTHLDFSLSWDTKSKVVLPDTKVKNSIDLPEIG